MRLLSPRRISKAKAPSKRVTLLYVLILLILPPIFSALARAL